MELDLSPLGNAVRRLREGLARHEREPGDEQLRDGLIQRFEFTYELTHKTLRRYLRDVAASPDEEEPLSFADLVRTGIALGLLHADLGAWREFRGMRTRTGHTYDSETAARVVAGIPNFLGRGRASPGGIATAIGMSDTARIDLTPAHLRLVRDILAAHLPPGARVWVFGSRASGRARRYSDLDLAIDAGRPLGFGETEVLREAFDDSDLPCKVDVVDWQELGERFRASIADERIAL
jgi:nucleotidyltransferase substrate binding protein (TIGR01987 family)